MPEFQLDQPLDEMLLLPMQPPGDTPTSDGDKSEFLFLQFYKLKKKFRRLWNLWPPTTTTTIK